MTAFEHKMSIIIRARDGGFIPFRNAWLESTVARNHKHTHTQTRANDVMIADDVDGGAMMMIKTESHSLFLLATTRIHISMDK